ncbi:MAG TPA: FKBP-type peptidyl-prolyl cis-trans isomerase [Opitutaceae bacterium]|nr:FKBP-type peptidyl-prolyl cis-trans isomerase [Opitutaceae bacterium]
MKATHSLSICLLALGLTSARAEDGKITVPGLSTPPPANASAPAASAPAAAAAPAANFTEAQLVEEFGWFIGKRVGLTELEFNKAEIDALIKGISTAAAGKDSPYELDAIGPKMDEFMQKKQTAYLAKLKQQNLETSTAFFNKLKENKNIVELPDGLRYEIVKQGDGTFPKPTETVKVNYTGTLIDGTVFDASDKHEPPGPAEFQLDQVITGWTEGIQKVSKGGKIKLYVPPQLAYGDDGRPGIPPGSTLVFDVELLDIKASAPAAPAMPTPATK